MSDSGEKDIRGSPDHTSVTDSPESDIRGYPVDVKN